MRFSSGSLLAVALAAAVSLLAALGLLRQAQHPSAEDTLGYAGEATSITADAQETDEQQSSESSAASHSGLTERIVEFSQDHAVGVVYLPYEGSGWATVIDPGNVFSLDVTGGGENPLWKRRDSVWGALSDQLVSSTPDLLLPSPVQDAAARFHPSGSVDGQEPTAVVTISAQPCGAGTYLISTTDATLLREFSDRILSRRDLAVTQERQHTAPTVGDYLASPAGILGLLACAIPALALVVSLHVATLGLREQALVLWRMGYRFRPIYRLLLRRLWPPVMVGAGIGSAMGLLMDRLAGGPDFPSGTSWVDAALVWSGPMAAALVAISALSLRETRRCDASARGR